MARRRRGGARLLTAAGAFLALALVYTGASTVYNIDGQATIVADRDFDIMVAGVPGIANDDALLWVQGNPEAYQVAMEPGSFGPGDERLFTLGVRNSSADLSGSVSLSVVDPDPDLDDLFPFLEFTLTRGTEVLFENVRGDDIDALADIALGEFAPGESTTLTFVVRFAVDAGNDAQGTSTHVRVHARGENT